MEDDFISGNEAVALAAKHSGIGFAYGYPGTPSTEIIENLISEGLAEWSLNEKIALENAFGTSYAGARSLASMKNVGLNVAADPLCTISYTGVNAGLVLVVCDDPHPHSSQNMQDSRHYAKLAKVPLLDAYDSQSAYDYTIMAFELSEIYDTAVIVRLTTRVCHAKGGVVFDKTLKNQKKRALKEIPQNPEKYVMLPSHAKARNNNVMKRLSLLGKLSEQFCLFHQYNEKPGTKLLITSGVIYCYCRDFLKDYDICCIGMPFPFPKGRIQELCSLYEEVFVLEELDPFVEEEVSRICKCTNLMKACFPGMELPAGELTPDIIVNGKSIGAKQNPPSMCKGCPHIPVFEVLKELDLHVIGDIGCYTLAALPPLKAMDSQLNMGMSISQLYGMEKVRGLKGYVAVIGDSTFLHSGFSSLLNSYYNSGISKIIILDNSTTAMTGHQDYPGAGEIDFKSLCSFAENIITLDPCKKSEMKKKIEEGLSSESTRIFVTNRPCLLK